MVISSNKFAVEVKNATKHYTIRHQKNPSLKDTLLKGRLKNECVEKSI